MGEVGGWGDWGSGGLLTIKNLKYSKTSVNLPVAAWEGSWNHLQIVNPTR